MKNSLIRFSVSLPQSLLEELDKKITANYSSRSEIVRDLIREKMTQSQWENSSDEKMGVLTIIYDHHKRELNQKLIDIQHHNHHIKILCTTHIHIDHNNCLETIIIKGKAKKIEQFCLEIGGLKGVKFSELTRAIPLEE
ncbi:MAG: nickel-responsive transcriptional regulator NikR [Helicobacter sp.]|nr:nickel-responsive transcriptional regulator NikR [Helicobacter sp.]